MGVFGMWFSNLDQGLVVRDLMYFLRYTAFLSWVPAVSLLFIVYSSSTDNNLSHAHHALHFNIYLSFIYSLIHSFSPIDYHVAGSELTLRNANMNKTWPLPLVNKSLMVGF